MIKLLLAASVAFVVWIWIDLLNEMNREISDDEHDD